MKSFKIVLVCALLVLISGGYLARSRAAAKVTAAKIAAANRGAALFKELANLSTISIQQAQQRYFALSPEDRREVWRAKLQAIRLDRLSEDKAQVVRDILASLDIISFDERERDKYQDIVTALYKRAVEAFGKEDTKIAFATLLDYDIFKSSVLLPTCECSTITDLCGPSSLCCRGCKDCSTRWAGCGLLWFQTCDGMCNRLWNPD